MKSNSRKSLRKSLKASRLEKEEKKNKFSSCRDQYSSVTTTEDYIEKIMPNDIADMQSIIPNERKGIIELSMNDCNKIEAIIKDFVDFQTKHYGGRNPYRTRCTEALNNIKDIKQQIQDKDVEDDDQKITFERKTVKQLRFFTYFALVKSSESLQELNNENKKEEDKKEEEKKEDKKESTEIDKKKKTHRRAKSQDNISGKYDRDKKNVEETVENDTRKKQKRGQGDVFCRCDIF